MRGLWVESLGAEPAIATPQGIDEVFSLASRFSVTDLFVQVYREGRAWFASRLAGQEFLTPCLNRGYEPLRALLDRAESQRIRVHAWMNVFNLGKNANASLLKNEGREVLLRDNFGVRIDAYGEDGSPPDRRAEFFSLDAPHLWLDPASVLVRERFLGTVSELLRAYPELSGVHLDFFRYPYLLPIKPSSRIRVGSEFGYGPDSLRRFANECGLEDAFERDPHGALHPRTDEISLRWDSWRREQVGRYLREIRERLSVGQRLSVACLAWSDRAYLTSYQNWRRWLESGIIDAACLMAYTADDELFSYLIRQAAAFQSERAAVVAGLGAYLLRDLAHLERQMDIAQRCGARGTILFSYENLKSWR